MPLRSRPGSMAGIHQIRPEAAPNRNARHPARAPLELILPHAFSPLQAPISSASAGRRLVRAFSIRYT